MPEYVEVKNQTELDKLLTKKPDAIPVLVGGATFTLTSGSPTLRVMGSSQPRVVAWGSSQPRVEARESSQPRVEARESSQPRVEAWGSSQPLVVAWGSSQPRVVARGSSQPLVVAWESSQPRVEARESSQPRVNVAAVAVAVVDVYAGRPEIRTASTARSVVRDHRSDRRKKLSFPGAVVIDVPVIETAEQWCDYYGVTAKRGVAMLYKAVDDGYSTGNARQRDVFYTPGSKPKAPDWDGGAAECGGGLHFSPHPAMALEFNQSATRFVACPVKVAEIIIHKDAQYPQKVKAPRVCGAVVEVDRFGDPV